MVKPHTLNSGLGLTAIIGIIALLAAGGATAFLITSNDPEPVVQNNETDLDFTNERAEVAELPPTAPASDTTAGTRLAGDPALEEMDDADMAADVGGEPLTLPEVEDEVVVTQEVADPLPLASGTFEDYDPSKLALAETGDVLLFFHADWCPSCRGLENDINKNLSNIPNGTHILKVDYDTETALKKQYGIVRQHTLVHVDESGNKIKTLTGLTNTLNQVVGQI